MAAVEANTEPKGRRKEGWGQSDGKLLGHAWLLHHLLLYFSIYLWSDPHKGGLEVSGKSSEWWGEKGNPGRANSLSKVNFGSIIRERASR